MTYVWVGLAVGILLVVGRVLLGVWNEPVVRPPDPGFGVRQADLLERLTVEQIEARERVQDPLGAAPELPFGHLNAAWKTFLSRGQPDDALWSFAARWREGGWRDEQREGYVWVSGSGPGPAFETVRRSLVEPQGEMPEVEQPLPQTRRRAWWQRGRAD